MGYSPWNRKRVRHDLATEKQHFFFPYFKLFILSWSIADGGTSSKEPACQCRDLRSKGLIPWRRAWQPTPGFLPGKSHGQRSLMGYSPYDCKELDSAKVT